MELLVVFGFFIVLALASLRWGYDSRPGLRDREYRQAFWAPDDWVATPRHPQSAQRQRVSDQFQTLLVTSGRDGVAVAAPAGRQPAARGPEECPGACEQVDAA